MCFVSGGVIILAVLIFYKKKAGLRPSFAPETSAGDPGWALFLSTVGAIIAVLNAVVIGVAVSRYSYRNLEKRRSIFGICAQGKYMLVTQSLTMRIHVHHIILH